MQDYKIILMDNDGDIICEYNSFVVPTAKDTILIDDERSFIVRERHFSINNFKVVLLGDLEKPIEPEFKK